MKIIQNLMLLLAFALSAHANTPDQIVEAFLKLHAEGKQAEALDSFFEGNAFALRKKNDIDSVKAKLSVTFSEEQYGKLLFTRKLSETTISGVLMEQVYLIGYERAPARFRFMFYKPKDEWLGHEFSFDTDLDNELEKKSNHLILKAD